MNQNGEKKKFHTARNILVPVGIGVVLFYLKTFLSMVLNINNIVLSLVGIALPILIIIFGIPVMFALDASNSNKK